MLVRVLSGTPLPLPPLALAWLPLSSLVVQLRASPSSLVRPFLAVDTLLSQTLACRRRWEGLYGRNISRRRCCYSRTEWVWSRHDFRWKRLHGRHSRRWIGRRERVKFYCVSTSRPPPNGMLIILLPSTALQPLRQMLVTRHLHNLEHPFSPSSPRSAGSSLEQPW